MCIRDRAKGKGDFTAYNGITYSLRNSQWTDANGNVKREEIFNALNWPQLNIIELEGLDVNPLNTTSSTSESNETDLIQLEPYKLFGFIPTGAQVVKED